MRLSSNDFEHLFLKLLTEGRDAPDRVGGREVDFIILQV
jgi:hypothetical protein